MFTFLCLESTTSTTHTQHTKRSDHSKKDEKKIESTIILALCFCLQKYYRSIDSTQIRENTLNNLHCVRIMCILSLFLSLLFYSPKSVCHILWSLTVLWGYQGFCISFTPLHHLLILLYPLSDFFSLLSKFTFGFYLFISFFFLVDAVVVCSTYRFRCYFIDIAQAFADALCIEFYINLFKYGCKPWLCCIYIHDIIPYHYKVHSHVYNTNMVLFNIVIVIVVLLRLRLSVI